MKKSIKWLLLTSIILILAACGKSTAAVNISERIDQAENPVITWGVKVDTNLFGYYNIEAGEIQGFDIDIAEALTKEIGGDNARAEFVEVTSKTRIPLLKNGNIDAIAATMTISEERLEEVDFSDVYFEAGQALLAPENTDITQVSDLTAEDTVLAVKGSTSAQRIREHAPDTNILELENYSEAFTALQSGQGEAMTTDNAILLGIMENSPGYTIAGGTFTEEPYGIAINKGQEDFLNEVNAGLETLIANGTYDEIFNKWFGDLGPAAEDSSVAN